MKSYGSFAEIYDELMDDFDYEQWADYYLSLLTANGKVPKTVCECACGTGSLTIPLSERGLRIIGSDISEDMLRVAADKTRKAGQQIRYICQDMCELTLPRKVEAILCTCDGLNYLTDLDRVDAFFRHAAESLKSGGCIALDFSSAYKLEKVLGNAFYGEEREDVVYLWSNTWNETEKTVTMNLTFFQKEPDGRYRRFSEEHIQRAHSVEEITRSLEKNGFTDIRVYGEQTKEVPKEDTLRIHITARHN